MTHYSLATIADSDFATGTHRTVSASTNFVTSAGDISRVSMASSASRLAISGDCSALRVSRLSACTISLGSFAGPDSANQRSEEHTSELQSLAYLVCRLL